MEVFYILVILKKLKLPLLIFLCTSIVLTALSSIFLLYQEKLYLEKELLKWQNEATRLDIKLKEINNYAHVYRTSPQVIAMVFTESEKYNINPTIMFELIKAESNFNPRAVSKVGAKGLCQIIPLTARELAGELNLTYNEESLFNYHYNIQLGTYYLSKLLKEYNMDYHKALTAYNRGPTGLKNYIKNRGTAVSRYSQNISSRSLQLTLNSAY